MKIKNLAPGPAKGWALEGANRSPTRRSLAVAPLAGELLGGCEAEGKAVQS